jgi:hypothetical protein
LAFGYKVTAYETDSELPDVNEDGVLVYGLFIEGARWDRDKNMLQDSFPMEMFSVIFILYISN